MKKLILTLAIGLFLNPLLAQKNPSKIARILKHGDRCLTIESRNETQIFYKGNVIIDNEKKVVLIYTHYDEETLIKWSKFISKKGSPTEKGDGVYAWEENILWEVTVIENTIILSAQVW